LNDPDGPSDRAYLTATVAAAPRRHADPPVPPGSANQSKVWPVPPFERVESQGDAIRLADMEEHQLGLARAIIIVWVSGIVASALISTFLSPVAWAMLLGSGNHVDRQWGSAAVAIAIASLLGAIGVTVGVSLCGFELGYASAAVALTLGGILAEAVMRFLVARTTRTADGFTLPAIGPMLWPLQLLLGTLLPAFIVNALASKRRSNHEVPPQLPYPRQSPLD
jgi:hypothetical protein